MTRRLLLALGVLSTAAFAYTGVAHAQAPKFKMTKVDIKGEGGTDYVSVESATGHVFVSRQTHVMVVNGADGKVLGEFQYTGVQPHYTHRFEEAGVQGKIAKRPMGTYAYDKRLKNGRLQHVRVAVFPLQVDSEADAYLELGQREKLWLPPPEAARCVEEPELMVLLATFQP